MASKTVAGDEKTKRMAALLDSLQGSRHRWEIWNDLIYMSAASISNAVDAAHRETREAAYLKIAEGYSPDELTVMSQMLAELIGAFEPESGGEMCYRDFLGDLFMRLGMGDELGGQFFTPYSVCRMMATITLEESRVREQLDKKGWIAINDCACGAGAMLIAGADALQEMGVNYQQHCIFVGQDINFTTALMCYLQLSLLGCAGIVKIDDTLRSPYTDDPLFGGEGGDNYWYTPMFFSGIWNGRRKARMMDRIIAGLEKSRKETTKPAKKSEPQQLSFFME